MAQKELKLKLPTADQLLEAGVHFGHQARRWHPKMEGYIYAQKSGIHVLDLYKTLELLEKACTFLYQVASTGGKIVYVGTKKQAREIVRLEAQNCGAMYMTDRWIGGTITNLHTIRKSIDKLKDHKRKKLEGGLSHYTKKERLMIDREIEKLERSFGGIINMTSKPDALFVVDARKEKTAVREAKRMKIPIVALIDTNSDPSGIAYPIPGNDDATTSIALITKQISSAVEEGYKVYAKESEKLAESEKAKEETPQPEQVEKVEIEILNLPVKDKEVLEEVKSMPQNEDAKVEEVTVEVPVVEVEPVKAEEEKKPEEKKKRGRPKKV